MSDHLFSNYCFATEVWRRVSWWSGFPFYTATNVAGLFNIVASVSGSKARCSWALWCCIRPFGLCGRLRITWFLIGVELLQKLRWKILSLFNEWLRGSKMGLYLGTLGDVLLWLAFNMHGYCCCYFYFVHDLSPFSKNKSNGFIYNFILLLHATFFFVYDTAIVHLSCLLLDLSIRNFFSLSSRSPVRLPAARRRDSCCDSV
ncbi:hypothetical protein HanRHA438_Chr02g0048271 [Helianthus annuus]|nr:hypothetical protein HanHA300_Chr02g0038551 [Helianthus annuus]KAJ0617378.1 hypothetical protein HanHA89_Chr02g0041191 [Helianthus annuus]KAJ0775918.1 hypothetical protein HanLR1_Chr02g0039711 [Helianthus annuus]KAJ0938301.1 hypothetical protein HanRHA438_Chr02g0048271 [Helianthus annuus]